MFFFQFFSKTLKKWWGTPYASLFFHHIFLAIYSEFKSESKTQILLAKKVSRK